jgi:hypothetical protein
MFMLLSFGEFQRNATKLICFNTNWILEIPGVIGDDGKRSLTQTHVKNRNYEAVISKWYVQLSYDVSICKNTRIKALWVLLRITLGLCKGRSTNRNAHVRRGHN